MLEIEYALKSDIGLIRSDNEDCVGVRSPLDDRAGKRDRHLFVIADGMGGQVKGEEAAHEAVMAILTQFIEDAPKDNFPQWLSSSYSNANSQVHHHGASDPEGRRRGTTLTSMLIAGDMVHFAHVGDSRAYLIRNQKMKRLSTDHTIAQEAVGTGTMTEEQAQSSPKRSYLTRALGYRPQVEVDTFQGKIHPGDIFVLTTDGLTSEVPEQIIYDVASKYPPQRAVEMLVKIANERGGRDNISLQVIRVLGKAKRRLDRRIVYSATAVLVAILLTLGIFQVGKKLRWFGGEKLSHRLVNLIDVETITEVDDFKEKVSALQEKAEKLKGYVSAEDGKKIDEMSEQLTQLHNKTDEDNLDANKPYLRDLNQQLLEIQAKYLSGSLAPQLEEPADEEGKEEDGGKEESEKER